MTTMDQLIAEFPDQLNEALAIGKAANITAPSHPIHNILVAGMGGSGIGANFCIEFTSKECRVPYAVTKGYSLPAYVNENTLLICSSYSGNTEETLMCLEEGLAKNAKIVVVASGGKMLEKAAAHGLDHIVLPAGKPSPRACLGYSFVQQLFILNKLGFITDTSIGQVETAADLLRAESDDIKQRAEIIAKSIHNKIPILYAADDNEASVVRFRQQLNENGKVLCWHHVVPEMNHNELVGWRKQEGRFAVIVFRNATDFSRTQARMEICKEVYQEYADTYIEVWSKGENRVERAMYLVNLGDWVSYYLCELRGMDCIEVKIIDYLKSELGKI